MDDVARQSQYQKAYAEAYNSRVARVQGLTDPVDPAAQARAKWILLGLGIFLSILIPHYIYTEAQRWRENRRIEEEERAYRIQIKPLRYDEDIFLHDPPTSNHTRQYTPEYHRARATEEPQMQREGISSGYVTQSRASSIAAFFSVALGAVGAILRSAFMTIKRIAVTGLWLLRTLLSQISDTVRTVRTILVSMILTQASRLLRGINEVVTGFSVSITLRRAASFFTATFLAIAALYLFKPILPDLPNLTTPTTIWYDVPHYSWSAWFRGQGPPSRIAIDFDGTTRVVDWYGTQTIVDGQPQTSSTSFQLLKNIAYGLQQEKEKAGRQIKAPEVTKSVTMTLTITKTERALPAITSQQTLTSTTTVHDESTITHTLDRTVVSILVATTTQTATVRMHYSKRVQKLLDAKPTIKFVDQGRNMSFCRICGQVHCCEFAHEDHLA